MLGEGWELAPGCAVSEGGTLVLKAGPLAPQLDLLPPSSEQPRRCQPTGQSCRQRLMVGRGSERPVTSQNTHQVVSIVGFSGQP